MANTGTYVDSPFHRYPDGADMAELPLDRLADLGAVVVDSRERALDRSALECVEVAGRAVLVRTGWSRHWRTDAYFEGHPFLTADAAAYLVDLDALPAAGFRFSAVPVKLRGLGTFPVRIYAVL